MGAAVVDASRDDAAGACCCLHPVGEVEQLSALERRRPTRARHVTVFLDDLEIGRGSLRGLRFDSFLRLLQLGAQLGGLVRLVAWR